MLNAIAERTLNADESVRLSGATALRPPRFRGFITRSPTASLRRGKRTGRRNWKISPAGTPAVADVSRSMSRSSAHKSR